MLGTKPVVVMETITELGAVPFAGPAEIQAELRARVTAQFKVPPPVLVICKVWERGKKGSDWMAVKLNEVGESEMKAGVGGAETV